MTWQNDKIPEQNRGKKEESRTGQKSSRSGVWDKGTVRADLEVHCSVNQCIVPFLYAQAMSVRSAYVL